MAKELFVVLVERMLSAGVSSSVESQVAGVFDDEMDAKIVANEYTQRLAGTMLFPTVWSRVIAIEPNRHVYPFAPKRVNSNPPPVEKDGD